MESQPSVRPEGRDQPLQRRVEGLREIRKVGLITPEHRPARIRKNVPEIPSPRPGSRSAFGVITWKAGARSEPLPQRTGPEKDVIEVHVSIKERHSGRSPSPIQTALLP